MSDRNMNSLSRREFIGAAAAAGVLSAGRSGLKGFAEKKPGRKHNFVVFLTDDQGYNDVGCFGSPNIRIPICQEARPRAFAGINVDFFLTLRVRFVSKALDGG